jgi:hypothetical protein
MNSISKFVPKTTVTTAAADTKTATTPPPAAATGEVVEKKKKVKKHQTDSPQPKSEGGGSPAPAKDTVPHSESLSFKVDTFKGDADKVPDEELMSETKVPDTHADSPPVSKRRMVKVSKDTTKIADPAEQGTGAVPPAVEGTTTPGPSG